ALETSEQLELAFAVRYEVFVMEQGVSEDGERDHLDTDPRTLHGLVLADEADAFGGGMVSRPASGIAPGALPGLPRATARLPGPSAGAARGEGTGPGQVDRAVLLVGRVAVLRVARGTGAGHLGMSYLEAAAPERPGGEGEVSVEQSALDHAI